MRVCDECGYDFDNPPYGFHVCPQCSTRYCFHAVRGWSHAPLIAHSSKRAIKPDHRFTVIEGKDETYTPPQTEVCIACHKPIAVFSGVYGRIIEGMIRYAVEGLRTVNGVILLEKHIVSYPRFITGNACRSCFDTLYSLKYENDKGEAKRAFECLNPPIRTTTETTVINGRERIRTVPYAPAMRLTHDDDLASGKLEIKRVTELMITRNHKGKITDVEEWRCAAPSKPEADEPCDPLAYHYFRRGR